MRRLVLLLVLGVLSAVPVLAQRGGGGHGGGGMQGGGGMRGGFGGMRGGGFRGGAGGFRGGFGRGGFRNQFGFRGSRFLFSSPFFYPAIYGGYPFFDYGYPFFENFDYGYPSSSYPYAGYSGGMPAVIINQNSGYTVVPPPEETYAPPPAPSIREYTGPTAPAQQKYEALLYLVAFRDGVIRAVLAYWVDGSTLHYVSMDREQKQAPLSTVDRELSTRLNRERNVTFALPN